MKTLNNTELAKVDGGLGFLLTVLSGLIVASGMNAMNNWDDFKEGLSEGYNNR